MVIAATLKDKLDALSIQYDLIVRNKNQPLSQMLHAMGLSDYTIVRSALLCTDNYFCLAVIPYNYLFDFAGLKSLTQKKLRFADQALLETMFPDCQPSYLPPFGQLYELDTFYETDLITSPSVFFESGTDNCLLRVSSRDFQRLMLNGRSGHISVAAEKLVLPQQAQSDLASIDFYLFQSLLPAPKTAHFLTDAPIPDLSEHATEIIQSYSDPSLTLADLKSLLHDKQALYQEICQIINSELFRNVFAELPAAVENEPENVYLNGCLYSLVMGLIILDQFKISEQYALSYKVLRNHALLSSALALRLAYEDYRSNVDRSILLLSGLLQNLGLFYYAQEQNDRYYLFNYLLQLNPGIDLIQLEWLLSAKRLLGKAIVSDTEQSSTQSSQQVIEENHAVLGAAIAEVWDLPEEVIYAIRYHHSPDYDEAFFQCPNLLLIANCLLLPDEQPVKASCKLSSSMFERIKVSPERCRQLALGFKNAQQDLFASLLAWNQSGVIF